MKPIKGLHYGSRLNVFVAKDIPVAVVEITVIYQDGVLYEEEPYTRRIEDGRRFEWAEVGETEREAIINHIQVLKSKKDSLEKLVTYWESQLPSE